MRHVDAPYERRTQDPHSARRTPGSPVPARIHLLVVREGRVAVVLTQGHSRLSALGIISVLCVNQCALYFRMWYMQ